MLRSAVSASAATAVLGKAPKHDNTALLVWHYEGIAGIAESLEKICWLAQVLLLTPTGLPSRNFTSGLTQVK